MVHFRPRLGTVRRNAPVYGELLYRSGFGGVSRPPLSVRRGPLPDDDAQAMGQWEHGSGFSVGIEAADRAGRERLLRYCARPPFAGSPWTGCANWIPSACSTRARSPVRAGGLTAPDPARVARPARRPDAAAADPPPPLLRGAGAQCPLRAAVTAGPRVRPAHQLVATTVNARLCALPGVLVRASPRSQR